MVINRNCFKNPQATYEIGSELVEHAKWIDARENNWGYPRPESFMHRIFDQFNRYTLASIEVCLLTVVQNFFVIIAERASFAILMKNLSFIFLAYLLGAVTALCSWVLIFSSSNSQCANI